MNTYKNMSNCRILNSTTYICSLKYLSTKMVTATCNITQYEASLFEFSCMLYVRG